MADALITVAMWPRRAHGNEALAVLGVEPDTHHWATPIHIQNHNK